jgi:hypothetical protein
MASETFVRFKDIVGKTMASSGQQQSPIFTSREQLGLVDNPDFRNFFVSLSEE